MNPITPCRLPRWQAEGMKKIAKEHKLSLSDIIRLGLNLVVLKYKGSFDRETLTNIEFDARKKMDVKK